MAGSTPASPSAEAGAAGFPRKPQSSPGREAWRRFRRHRMAVVGVAILATMIAAILFGPMLWRVAINDIDFGSRLARPSGLHPFGTDDLGQAVPHRVRAFVQTRERRHRPWL